MMLPRLGALLGIVLLAGQAVPGEPEAAPPPRGLDQHLDPMPSGVVARMGSFRWRLEAQGFVFAVFSADGKQLMGVSGNGVAQVWDVASGREVRRLGTIQRQGTAIPGASSLPSPDGRLLTIYGNLDKVFRVWDVQTGQELWKVEPTGKVGMFRGIAFSPDGRMLLAEAPGGVWSVRQAETGTELCQLPQNANAKERNYNPVFAPDGRTFATTSQDSLVRIWESRTGKKLHELGKPVDAKTGYSFSSPPAFSPDGQRLAVVTYTIQRPNNVIRDKMVTIWDTQTGQQVSRSKLSDNPNQFANTFSADLRYLAHIGEDLAMRLHDLETGKELHQLGGPQPNGIGRRSHFAPDGKTLVITGNRTERGILEIHAYDTASGKELWRREAASATLAFSPNSALVATAMPVGLVQVMQVLDTRTGKDLTDAFGHRGPIQVLALSRDQKTLTTQAYDGVRQWEMATGKELRRHEPPEASRRNLLRTVSPDGQTAAYLTEANGKAAIELWDLAGDKAIRQIDLPQPGLLGLAFSPDGLTLAVRSAGVDRVARLLDVATAKERAVLTEQVQLPGVLVGNTFPKTGFAFSSDGGTLATTWNVTIQTNPNTVDRREVIYLTRTSNGRPLGRIEPGQGASILAVAFSPDGRNVAGVVTQAAPTPNPAPATSLVLWERISGKERYRFSTEPADALAIAPDGRCVAVGHRDGAIHLYELGSGQVIAKLTGHLSGVTSLLFSPDGRQLISGSSDTSALVWDLTSIRYPALPPAVPLTAQQVQTAWTELAGADAGKAFQAIQRLAAAPENALPILQVELKPVPLIDRQRLEKLVANLESNDFQVREGAAEELERIGELALPILEKSLAGNPTLEARQRLEKIRDRATGTTLSSEEIRILRALEALERIDSPKAKQVLEELAQGAGGARQTREAQASLDWLGRRAR